VEGDGVVARVWEDGVGDDAGLEAGEEAHDAGAAFLAVQLRVGPLKAL